MNESEAKKHPASRGVQADQEVWQAARDQRDANRIRAVDVRAKDLERGGVLVSTIKAKPTYPGSSEWLVVVTACLHETPVVAFNTADGLLTALAGACDKLVQGRLKWKEDEYGSC